MDETVPTFQELPDKRVAEPTCSHPGQGWPRDLLLQGLRAERGLLSLPHSPTSAPSHHGPMCLDALRAP